MYAGTVSMSMGSSVANLSIAGAVVVLRVNSRSTGHLSLACNICGESYKYIADLERLGQVTIPPPPLIQQWYRPFHHTSPLILPAWQEMLQSHPDRRYVSFLLQGIAEGFRVGMDRSQVRLRSAKRNHRSVNQRPAVVDAHIQRERQAGRLLGPLPHSLLPLCQVSPIGLVPKSQPGQWRLIVDLSFPEGHSINDGIAQDVTSIQYAQLEDAVQMVRVLGRGTLLAKVDLKSAYQVVPVHRDDWSLAIQWERQTYLDTALPFGL